MYRLRRKNRLSLGSNVTHFILCTIVKHVIIAVTNKAAIEVKLIKKFSSKSIIFYLGIFNTYVITHFLAY